MKLRLPLVLMSALIAASSHAKTVTWDSAQSSGTWVADGGGVWADGATFVQGDDVLINGGGPTVTVSGEVHTGQLTVNGTDATLTGDGTITGTQLTKQGGNTLTISSDLLGAGGAAFSDGIVVEGGTLKIGNNNGSWSETSNDVSLGAGAITVKSGALLRLHFNQWKAAKNGQNSLLNDIVLESGARFGMDDGGGTFAGNMSLLGAVSLANSWQGGHITLSGILSGGSSSVLTLDGHGQSNLTHVYITNAANTYSGTVKVNSSSNASGGYNLHIGSNTALQNATVSLDASAGGKSILSIDEGATDVTIAGLQGTARTEIIRNGSSAATLTVNNSVDNTYNGSVTGTGLSFTKTGTGNLTMGGSTNIGGVLGVNGGTLTLATGASVQASSIAIASAGTLVANSSSAISAIDAALTGNGAFIQRGAAANVLSLNGSLSGFTGNISVESGTLVTSGAMGGGNIAIASGGTFKYSTGSAMTIANTITGSGDLYLTGGGSYTFTSASTGFTGNIILDTGSTLIMDLATGPGWDALGDATLILNTGSINLTAPGSALSGSLGSLYLESNSLSMLSIDVASGGTYTLNLGNVSGTGQLLIAISGAGTSSLYAASGLSGFDASNILFTFADGTYATASYDSATGAITRSEYYSNLAASGNAVGGSYVNASSLAMQESVEISSLMAGTMTSGDISLDLNGNNITVTGSMVSMVDTNYSVTGDGLLQVNSLSKTGSGLLEQLADITVTGSLTATKGAWSIGEGKTLTVAGDSSIVSTLQGKGTMTILGTMALSGTNTFEGTINLGDSSTAAALALGGDNTASTGTINLANSGSVITFTTAENLGSYKISSLQGGTLQWAVGSTANILPALANIQANSTLGLDTNGNDIVLNHGSDIALASGLTLIKEGQGTLSITSKVNTAANWTIAEGTLSLGRGNSNTGTILGTATVKNGATLLWAVHDCNGWGTGGLQSITVEQGGQLAIANTNSSITMETNLVLLGGKLTGVSGSNVNYNGGSIIADGAADSVIDVATFVMRRNGNNTFEVRDGSTLTITSKLIDYVYSSTTHAQTLVKTGAGKLILSGETKTYTGGTVINEGILQLGKRGYGSQSFIRGTVTINSGGQMNLVGGDSFGYNGDTESITRADINGGILYLADTGNQTFKNTAFNLNGGTITGVSGGRFDMWTGTTINTTADNTGSVISNINLQLRAAGANTFNILKGSSEVDLLITANIVENANGSAILDKQGDGTLVLSGNNTYRGGTSVSGGTLVATTGSSLGTGSVTIENGSVLAFDSTANDISYGGTINAASAEQGTLSITGGRTVQITGDNTGFTSNVNIIGNTTLELGNGGTTGSFASATVNIQSGSTLAYNKSGTYSTVSAVQGSGNVVYKGSGTTTLGNAQTGFSGKTQITAGKVIADNQQALGTTLATVEISGGMLQVGQSGLTTGDMYLLAGILDAGAGGALQTGDLNVMGGSLYLGVSPGLARAERGTTPVNINVDGNFTMTSGDIYINFVSGAAHDQILGTAGNTFSVSGGTIHLVGLDTYTYGEGITGFQIFNGFDIGTIDNVTFTGLQSGWDASINADGYLVLNSLIPEPASSAMFAVTLLGAAFRRKRAA